MLLLGAAIIGTNASMVRWAQMPPTASAFWRMAFSALLFALLIRVQGGWRPMPARAWRWSLVPAVAFACDLWMWHRSIALVGPGLSTLLANAQVFFVALAGVAVFGERLSLRFVAGVLLAFFGLWLLLGADWATLPPQYRWGVWLGLATGLAYAVYNIGIKRAQQVACTTHGASSTVQILCVAAFGSAVLLGGIGLAEGSAFAFPSWRSLALIAGLAAFGHCLAWLLISRAMPLLPVAMVGLLLLLQPIVAYLLDVALGLASPGPRQWSGLAVTLGGLFIAGLPPRGTRSAGSAADPRDAASDTMPP